MGKPKGLSVNNMSSVEMYGRLAILVTGNWLQLCSIGDPIMVGCWEP